MLTQTEKVFNYLEAGRTLTAPEARSRFGIQNLRARIYDLREDGVNITTVPYVRKNGQRAVKYQIAKQSNKRARRS
jgi:hypothetical protein